MTYIAVFLAGVLFMIAFNRTRWAVFPISGGPFGWMGGPSRLDVATDIATAAIADLPLCDDPTCGDCTAIKEGRPLPAVACDLCKEKVHQRSVIFACNDCCAKVGVETMGEAVDDPASLQ